MSAQREMHMTPQQAADAAGVSRWAVLRAMDNRGVWRIAPGDLAEWAAQRAQPKRAQLTAQDGTAELRVRLAAAEVRAEAAERARDQAEADRDHWRGMAETLAAKRRRLWPW